MGNANRVEESESSEVQDYETKAMILAERAQEEARKMNQELVVYFKQPGVEDPNLPPPVEPPKDWMVLSCVVWFLLCNPLPGIIAFIFSGMYTKINLVTN